MKNAFRFAAVLALASFLQPRPATADVRLPRVFGNNMVLQRDIPVPVWGWASPGETVQVRVGQTVGRTTAGKDGRWMVRLKAMAAGGPLEMIVRGPNTVRFTNVLVGDVWVCSGQSNMAWPVSRANRGQEEVAAARHPTIRLLTVPQKQSGCPEQDAEIQWQACNPQTIGSFSAVAYFFGRELNRKLNVPIGLINTSWGGTAIEPWTPREGFALVPSLASFKADIDRAEASYRELVMQYLAGLEKWLPEARTQVKGNGPMPTLPPWPDHPWPEGERKAPATMYNAMVAPLVPYGIRGAIWYQGEANVGQGMAYHDKMKALIGGWRKVWGQGDFGFYFVQLAPYGYTARAATRPDARRGQFVLPELWEAQLATLSVPNTGMAVTTDIGNVKDIHPTNKQEVGRRLSLWALAGTYGQKDIVYSGPLYKSMAIEDGRIRVRFDHVGGGLASRDGKPLSRFQIAGDDGKFVDAKAEIDGDSVIVSSESVARPKAVRFGWAEDAEPNLMNREGLPASPFRTDRGELNAPAR